ncbi:universal stress protein [Streptomyces sp. YIM 132580]|uniref:universal stress protein n=1 Tax=Streptomyces sp. YIM 132580 TaxID=2691958 RepID=UPI00301D3021
MAGARERQPGLRTTASRLEGPPAPVLAGLTREARMVVLGSRHLGRLEEFLSAGSLVVPVTAQAHCPVTVVGRAGGSAARPPYLVVGVDGGEPPRRRPPWRSRRPVHGAAPRARSRCGSRRCSRCAAVTPRRRPSAACWPSPLRGGAGSTPTSGWTTRW